MSIISSRLIWKIILKSLKLFFPHDNFHLVFMASVQNFFFPIQMTCVLSKFTFNPENSEKCVNTSRVSLIEQLEPSSTSEVSSAYCDILYSVPFTVIPLIFLLHRIIQARISTHRTKIKGDKG